MSLNGDNGFLCHSGRKRMKKQKGIIAALMLICITAFGCLFAASSTADDKHGGRGHFEREDQHGIPFLGTDNEGNETTGQIAAWLLLVANLPVALSILIKWLNRFVPLWPKLKGLLSNFNRFQKKHLMFLHYYLNPAILGVVVWHYMASRCLSTSLPEWGLFLMVSLMTCGILIKFRLCPHSLRKTAHQLHTQPFIFIALILVLTVGHTIVD
jgi:hypothetical protein